MSSPREFTIAQATPQPSSPPPAPTPPAPAAPLPPLATRARVTIPTAIKPNTSIEVRTVISHVMETGQRKDQDGRVVPRNIINAMSALYRNKSVFSADLHASTSANPYIAFWLRVTEPGPLVVTWTDDKGQTVSETAEITFS